LKARNKVTKQRKNVSIFSLALPNTPAYYGNTKEKRGERATKKESKNISKKTLARLKKPDKIHPQETKTVQRIPKATLA